MSKVKEVFGDFYAINPDLFSFDIPTTVDLLMPTRQWGLESQAKSN